MSSEPRGLKDKRQSTHGWPLAVLIVLAVFAVIFAWRAILGSSDDFAEGNVATALMTFIAAGIWVAGSAGIIHNGRRMRRLAWTAWTINLVVPLGTLVVSTEFFSRVSPWFHAGSTYFYIPTVLSAIALALLAWSSPSQIASRNGG